MINITRGKKLQLVAQIDPGKNTTISEIIWYFDESIISTSISILLDTLYYSYGRHTIKLYSKNSCDNFDIIEQIINIIEVTNMVYTQTDTLAVNQGTVAMAIKLRRIATVTITVTDELDVPVASALVDIGGGITGTTDALGVVSLTNVPFGNKTVTTSIA